MTETGKVSPPLGFLMAVCWHPEIKFTNLSRLVRAQQQKAIASWAWWHPPVIPAPERWLAAGELLLLGQSLTGLHSNFQVSQGYKARPCLKASKQRHQPIQASTTDSKQASQHPTTEKHFPLTLTHSHLPHLVSWKLASTLNKSFEAFVH